VVTTVLYSAFGMHICGVLSKPIDIISYNSILHACFTRLVLYKLLYTDLL